MDLVAVRIFFAEGAVDDAGEFFGTLGRAFADWLGIILQDVEDEGAVVIAGEWALVADHFIEHDAESPDVGALVGMLAAQLLGRHVAQSAEQRARLRVGTFRDARDAEIHHFDYAIESEDNVGGLDIAVDHAAAMGIIEGAAGLHDVAEFLRERERRFAGDQFLQAFAFEVFHGDEGKAVRFGHFVDGDDVGMLQAAGGFCFAVETLEQVGIFHDHGGDRFYGDGAADEGIARFEDYAHGAAAELAENFVSADLLQAGTPLEPPSVFYSLVVKMPISLINSGGPASFVS